MQTVIPPWGVLWDVDGTLVDTAELHYQAWQALARELHKPFTRLDFAGTFGWRNPEIIPKLFGHHYPLDEVIRLGDRKEDLYREEAKKGVALLPGVQALLETVRSHGARQGIGSSAPRRNIDLILDLTRTAAMFSAIVSMEETARGKPDPQVFLLGAERIGIAPGRCVVLEDAPVGIQAAKAAGMWAIGVTFVGHHSAATLRAAGADLIVPTLEEVNIQQMLDWTRECSFGVFPAARADTIGISELIHVFQRFLPCATSKPSGDSAPILAWFIHDGGKDDCVADGVGTQVRFGDDVLDAGRTDTGAGRFDLRSPWVG